MRTFRIVALLCVMPSLIGCVSGAATSAKKITAIPYPDSVFRGMTCDKREAEFLKIQANLMKLTTQQTSERRKDQGKGFATGLLTGGLIPSDMVTSGNSETSSNLARIKGKHESMIRVRSSEECTLDTPL
mgnify:CR=1 FL=1